MDPSGQKGISSASMPNIPITSAAGAWTVVLISGLLEIVFSTGMKLSEGYTRPLPAVLSLAAAVLSVWMMSQTLRVIPVGTAYAVWAGIGAAGTALVGIAVFQEPAGVARLACLGLIVAGIIGLQLQGAG